MNILYYSSGTTGIGRLVFGISMYNALKRKSLNFSYTILSCTSAHQASIFEKIPILHLEIPPEDLKTLSQKNYSQSLLYKSIDKVNPDILIVDRMWLTLYNFIEKLKCKKIFICSQVYDHFFKIKIAQNTLNFKKDQYDRVIAIEPFQSTIEMEHINPMIIRNREEIYSREKALKELGLSGEKKVCFIGMNYKQGFFENLKEKYSYIEDEGDYDVIYSTNMKGGGIFPIADYYNAIDLLICPPTYNHFWEAIYFNKEAIFEYVPVRFCDLKRRIEECSDYSFKQNGADQLANIILNL